MQRKISATFTVEIEQLERLSEVASARRINRSLIVRDAIDRELKRYDEEELEPVKAVEVINVDL